MKCTDQSMKWTEFKSPPPAPLLENGILEAFLEILLAYPLKSSNLFNFREGHQKGRGLQQGGTFSVGVQIGNVTPLWMMINHSTRQWRNVDC